jgi:hypothetical protein
MVLNVSPPLATCTPPPNVLVAVVEALMRPMAVKSPTTVEEAEEINPESSVVRPETAREEEAESAPPTYRVSVTVLDAWETKPDCRVERPAASKVERSSVAPVASRVEEARSAPVTWRELSMVEDAWETKPLLSVESPDTANVEEALSAPVTFRLEVKVEEAAAMRPPEESMEKRVEEAEERIWNGMPV